MQLTHFTLANIRSVAQATIEPTAQFNLITGDNGAGKTSILEALHVLSNGKSFRGRVGEGLIQVGRPHLEIYARWVCRSGLNRQIGLRHTGSEWEGRIDGQNCALLSDLCTALAAVTFEPGSHALIDGRSDQRRRMMDWGLFHVEPEFIQLWRRWSRAHKQRNALLKQRIQSTPQMEAWEAELAQSGEAITRLRADYIDALVPRVRHWGERLLPELGEANLHFAAGWRRQSLSLEDALLVQRARDLAAGFTTTGPHRADWSVEFALRAQGERLSRGQTKLAALIVILAQAEHYAFEVGEWPIVLLDDLASELDIAHRASVLSALAEAHAQVFITGTNAADLSFPTGAEVRVFHVEHGVIGEA